MASIQEVVKIIKSLSKSDRVLLLKILTDTPEIKAESGFNSIKTKVTCPHCHSNHFVKNGFRGEIQRFICKDCKKSFITRTNTITKHSKKSYETWCKFLECMMNGLFIRRSAEICGINKDTSFIWRHKVFE